MGPGDEMIVTRDLEFFVIQLVLVGMLNRRHIDSFVNIEFEL